MHLCRRFVAICQFVPLTIVCLMILATIALRFPLGQSIFRTAISTAFEAILMESSPPPTGYAVIPLLRANLTSCALRNSSQGSIINSSECGTVNILRARAAIDLLSCDNAFLVYFQLAGKMLRSMALILAPPSLEVPWLSANQG